mmetsp:Transcript_3428/g.5110  ORF Transcript_3428/g.5110 Transcript_3428/m.5110 type:complete len:384 (+) Transcript_3428:73-1224(+)
MQIMSNRTESTRENGGQQSSLISSQDLDTHFSRSSHRGLSALLNAVTIHISRSGESGTQNGQEQDCKDRADAEHCCHGSDKKSGDAIGTPTIVPESNELLNDNFPRKLMTLLLKSDNGDIITFLPDGKYFALRKDKFAERLMGKIFALNSYDSFRQQLNRWGFELVATTLPDINVFRHRLFRKGDWELCEKMNETKADSSKLIISTSEAANFKDVPSMADRNSCEGTKRRLSPSTGSEITDTSSSKLRLESNGKDNKNRNNQNECNPDDYRSKNYSASIKLDVCEENDQRVSLVQKAVSSATQSIVADAIEALLWDEDHTRKTFENHAEELSKSSVNGLVPISKQLFASREKFERSDHGRKRNAHATSVEPGRQGVRYTENIK